MGDSKVVIDKPIIKYKVVQQDPQDNIILMHERLKRPETLEGTTYKFKPGGENNHAFYVTINDITLNPNTPHECKRPFEIFVNSKNIEQYQWVVALTRLISAIFRKGGDVTFLVEEMQAVFDPNGGYFKPGGGGFMPSVVAELGTIVETHLTKLGMLQSQEPSYTIDGAKQCPVCKTNTIVMSDGCETCLNCGGGKCS